MKAAIWFILGLYFTSMVAYAARTSRFDEFQGGTFTGDSATITTINGTTVNGGNLQLTGNSLISTDTNGNIILNPDGTGLTVFNDLTATTVPYLGASKELLSSAVTPTELGYLSGVTSSLCGISDTCTFTNKLVGVDAGSVGSPAVYFDADTDNGLYYVGTDQYAFSAGGVKGLELRKATGSFANLGMGGNASVSNQYPLLIERSQDATLNVQLSNPSTNAAAASCFELKSDNSANTGTICSWAGLTAVDAYEDRMVLRATDSAGGMSLVADSSATEISTYVGGVAAANEIAVFDSAGLDLKTENELRFEDSAGGEYIGFKAPATVTSSTTFTLPDGDGSNTQVLTTNGSGTLSWANAGSGSGVGGKDYFDGEGNFEVDVSRATAYDDTGAYVDGTGGSPAAISVSQNSTTPLRDTNDLDIAKAASDGSGEGVTILSDTINRADVGKALFFEAQVDSNHANYTSGDVCVQAYDVAGAAILPVQAVSGVDDDGCLQSVEGAILVKVLTTSSTTGAVRVSLHLESDSATASAWNIYVDDARLKVDSPTPINIITEWQSYTPTTQGFGTISSIEAWYRRIGDSVEVYCKFTSGTVTASEAQIGLPSGLTGDTTKLAAQYNNSNHVGTGTKSGSGEVITVLVDDTDAGVFKFGIAGASLIGLNFFNGNQVLSSTQQMSFHAKVPIEGWTSGNVISTQESYFKTVKVFAASNGGGSVTASTTDIDFTEVLDSHNAWSGTVFTAPTTGRYRVSGNVSVTVGGSQVVSAYKNGTIDIALSENDSGTLTQFDGTLDLTKGDQLSFRLNQTKTLNASSTAHWLSISEEPDLSVFGVFGKTETVEIQDQPFSYPSWVANQWLDIASFDLTPGEWDVFVTTAHRTSSATAPGAASDLYTHIHTVSGNNAGTLAYGENAAVTPFTNAVLESMTNTFKTNITVSSTTTYYLKQKTDITPTASSLRLDYYKVFARRIK